MVCIRDKCLFPSDYTTVGVVSQSLMTSTWWSAFQLGRTSYDCINNTLDCLLSELRNSLTTSRHELKIRKKIFQTAQDMNLINCLQSQRHQRPSACAAVKKGIIKFSPIYSISLLFVLPDDYDEPLCFNTVYYIVRKNFFGLKVCFIGYHRSKTAILLVTD